MRTQFELSKQDLERLDRFCKILNEKTRTKGLKKLLEYGYLK